MIGLLTCVFKLPTVLTKKYCWKYWWKYGIYWYWYCQYFFHEVYVLVLTILLKSIVNNTEQNKYLHCSTDNAKANNEYYAQHYIMPVNCNVCNVHIRSLPLYTVKHFLRASNFCTFRELDKIAKLHTRNNSVCPSKAWSLRTLGKHQIKMQRNF